MSAPIDLLHDEIDVVARHLHVIHAARTQCKRGCAGCCVDDLTVFEVEAEPIRRAFAQLLAEGLPHAPGGCAFLDDAGGCRVYASRPYVCRTQGLPLRWLDEDEQGTFEQRDICPLNEAGEPIEQLPERDCFTLGPVEERLGRLAIEAGDRVRVGLRTLFAHPAR